MSDSHLDPLPEDLQELLRNTPRPPLPAGFEERLRGRLEQTLVDGGSGSPDLGGGAGTAGAAGKLGSWGLPLVFTALVVGALGGYLAGRQDAPRPPEPRTAPAPEPAAVLEPAPEPAPEEVLESEPQPVPAAPREDPAQRRDPSRPTPRRPTAAPAPEPPEPPEAPSPAPGGRDIAFAEERALIELARTSLARGERLRALSSLEEHARSFPDGQLAEEREVLWINALISLGQADAARQKAAEFRQRFPRSMLLPAVEAALDTLDAP